VEFFSDYGCIPNTDLLIFQKLLLDTTWGAKMKNYIYLIHWVVNIYTLGFWIATVVVAPKSGFA